MPLSIFPLPTPKFTNCYLKWTDALDKSLAEIGYIVIIVGIQ
jgi:hypothetical protein